MASEGSNVQSLCWQSRQSPLEIRDAFCQQEVVIFAFIRTMRLLLKRFRALLERAFINSESHDLRAEKLLRKMTDLMDRVERRVK